MLILLFVGCDILMPWKRKPTQFICPSPVRSSLLGSLGVGWGGGLEPIPDAFAEEAEHTLDESNSIPNSVGSKKNRWFLSINPEPNPSKSGKGKTKVRGQPALLCQSGIPTERWRRDILLVFTYALWHLADHMALNKLLSSISWKRK